MTTLTAPRPVPGSPAAAPLVGRAKIVDDFRRAFQRAVAHQLVCYRHLDADGNWDGTGDVPSVSEPGKEYNVSHDGGSDWARVKCPCKASGICMHDAVYAFALAHGVWAVRPAPRCEPCDPTFCNGGCPDAPTPEQLPASSCNHEWTSVGSADFHCLKCDAWYSYEGSTPEERYTPGREFVTPEDFFDPERAAQLAERYAPDPVHERQLAITSGNWPGHMPLASRIAKFQAESHARATAEEAAFKAKQSAAVDAALAVARDGYRGIDPLSDFFN